MSAITENLFGNPSRGPNGKKPAFKAVHSQNVFGNEAKKPVIKRGAVETKKYDNDEELDIKILHPTQVLEEPRKSRAHEEDLFSEKDLGRTTKQTKQNVAQTRTKNTKVKVESLFSADDLKTEDVAPASESVEEDQ
jgi:hypothetical protein